MSYRKGVEEVEDAKEVKEKNTQIAAFFDQNAAVYRIMAFSAFPGDQRRQLMSTVHRTGPHSHAFCSA